MTNETKISYLCDKKIELPIITTFRSNGYKNLGYEIENFSKLMAEKKTEGSSVEINGIFKSIQKNLDEYEEFIPFIFGNAFEGIVIKSPNSDLCFVSINLPSSTGNPIEATAFASGCFQELFESMGLNPITTNCNFSTFYDGSRNNEGLWVVNYILFEPNVRSMAFSVIENLSVLSK